MTHRMPPAGVPGVLTRETLATAGASGGPPFREVYARSEVGHRRAINEDHFLVLDVLRRMRVVGSSLGATGPRGDTTGTLLVVADGMGGRDHGELASAVAIDTIAELASRALPVDLTQEEASARTHAELQRVVRECQRRVLRAAWRDGVSARRATTMTALYAQDRTAEIAHVGDSRAYLSRPGQGVWRLTHDHTSAEYVESVTGQAAPRVAHILTNAIGGTPEEPRVEALHVPLASGDRLLLCSDGLTEELDDVAIGAELACGLSARRTVDALMARVLEGAARDDVTILVADV